MEIIGEFDTSVHRALKEIDPKYEEYEGLVLCGTHSPDITEIDFLLDKIMEAREAGKPFLGICYGHQLAAVEYAINVLGISDAVSEEWEIPGTAVVKKRDNLKVGWFGGESYWNNYEVALENWQKDENFITTQFHPEYQSSKLKPHPILIKFLKYAKQYGRRKN